MREGVCDEKIEYSGTDDVGQLVENFNIMSNTIKKKKQKNRYWKDEFLQ